jgi:hypothetical protein
MRVGIGYLQYRAPAGHDAVDWSSGRVVK